MSIVGTAFAQQEPKPPAGLTQQQFDALVEAISASVAKKLKENPPHHTAPAAAHPAIESELDSAAVHFAWLVTRAKATAAAIPLFFSEVARIPDVLFAAREPKSGTWFLAQLLLAGLAALAAESVVRWWLRSFRRRWTDGAGEHGGVQSLGRLGLLLLADLVGLAAVWLVSYGSIALMFGYTGDQAELATLVLSGLFAWRLYLVVFRVVLRPGEANARLIRASDDDCTTMFDRLSTAILMIVALRVLMGTLVAIDSPVAAIAAGRLVGLPAVLVILLWMLTSSRGAVTSWAKTLLGETGVGGAVARHAVKVVGTFLTAILATQLYGALTTRPTIPGAMLLTLNIGIALVMLETILQAFVARMTRAGQEEMPSIYALIARCTRVAALIFAAVVVARVWTVEVFQVVDHATFQALTEGTVSAGFMAFVAYVAWELIHLYLGKPTSKDQNLGPSEAEAGTPTSRIATLLPLLRIVALIAVFAVAALIILSELGIDTAPLIAGISVFGLALSFGSQALVRDIVSGMFYLADDAFRVGEYIDCGKAKGTVEGFTLRSIRLRHQNGQIHTIPFGQLGQITNFSRDWTTLKFNLKFKRDTDIEKLRKVVKRIGQEMAEDEELKSEFLEPLKMQGVADILDNALVVRFKFTVKPGKPTYIQRQAIKRMVAALPAEGIDFATATVAVQAIGATSSEVANAAAAIQARQKEADAAKLDIAS
jgi:small-conductance mechanosensitive channel